MVEELSSIVEDLCRFIPERVVPVSGNGRFDDSIYLFTHGLCEVQVIEAMAGGYVVTVKHAGQEVYCVESEDESDRWVQKTYHQGNWEKDLKGVKEALLALPILPVELPEIKPTEGEDDCPF